MRSQPPQRVFLRRAIFGDSSEACLVNTIGKIIIKPGQFRELDDFHKRPGWVLTVANGKEAGAYIDTTGKIVIGPLEDTHGDAFISGYAVQSRP